MRNICPIKFSDLKLSCSSMRKCSIVIFEVKTYFQYQGHMAHGHLNRREKILFYAATFLVV